MRYPFSGVPLVSGSAQLGTGLVALGIHPNLAGALTAWVHAEQHDDGGWGDGDGPSDLLTTFVAAELLAGLDPEYDPLRTARFFGANQRADGWWRACGPEATWLTVEILDWLLRAERPFAERFSWPHLAVTNRDRRTGVPFYGYFSDLERLFDAVPGLAKAPIDLAFIDLAGFGEFNNALGMDMGDRVLRTFAQALARIPGTMAIRDGGDEFIVLGPPTGTAYRSDDRVPRGLGGGVRRDLRPRLVAPRVLPRPRPVPRSSMRATSWGGRWRASRATSRSSGRTASRSISGSSASRGDRAARTTRLASDLPRSPRRDRLERRRAASLVHG